MEKAELAAHATVVLPSAPINQDMDAQLRYLLLMLTSGPRTADRTATAECETCSTFLGTTARAHRILIRSGTGCASQMLRSSGESSGTPS